jgi:hypothetical protein
MAGLQPDFIERPGPSRFAPRSEGTGEAEVIIQER